MANGNCNLSYDLKAQKMGSPDWFAAILCCTSGSVRSLATSLLEVLLSVLYHTILYETNNWIELQVFTDFDL